MKVKGIEISNPDKILYPEEGYTKKRVAQYYARIAKHLLTHGGSRPLTLRCFPDGISEDGFFCKSMPDHFPGFIPRIQVPTRSSNKPEATMAAAEGAADLVYFAGQNAIELHAALSTGKALEEPDRIVFDFDPSNDDFAEVCRLVGIFKEVLRACDITAFVNTTGSRGLHVHLPLRAGSDFDQSKRIAGNLAGELHKREPGRSTLEQRKDRRGNRVFIDTLRNAYGQTIILPYSLRAGRHAPVATPVRWDEIRSPQLSPRKYTLANIFRRLGQVDDPWKEFNSSRQSADTLESLTRRFFQES